MRMTRVFVAIGLIAGLCGAASAAGTWKDYSYTPQHFAVSFPAPPQIIAANGSFIAHDGGDDPAGFTAVAACNVSPGLTPAQMVSNAIESSRMNGKIRDLADVAAGPVPGKAMVVDRVDGITVRQRIFARAGCFYVIFAGIGKGRDEKQTARFLDSFRLL